MKYVELLTEAEVRRTHEASLEVLETVGILAHFAPAREVFKKHGCIVDDETGLVRFPAEVVEKYRKMAPPSFTFRGRDPQYDRTIPDAAPSSSRARRRPTWSTPSPASSAAPRRPTSPTSRT